MAAQQPWVVRGVAGGVGARTLAAAMGLPVRAPWQPSPCHVLVARGTVHSLAVAERDVNSVPQQPVLAIVADRDGLPRTAKAKLTMLRPHISGTVVLPWVPRWREVLDPYAEARSLCAAPDERPPRYLVPYWQALHQLGQAVAAAFGAASTHRWPSTDTSWLRAPLHEPSSRAEVRAALMTGTAKERTQA